jgi:hypothetical protein
VPLKLTLILPIVAAALHAQLPFYTDDPGVTERGTLHFEFFNEFDALQHPQYPNLRQNTANYKVNYGLPHNLELDLDSPYLAIYRAVETSQPTAAGIGDTNLGIKWNFHKESQKSRMPALGASFYVEFPTGDSNNQLGSGLTDYALNVMVQKHLTEKTRITANAGILFAGNTSTGALGIQSTRGRVITGGLSLLRDLSPKWTLGAEVVGGFTANAGLGKSQIQVMAGGMYNLRDGLAFSFGLLGGVFVASPRVGAQIGFAIDLPTVWHRPAVN